MGLAWGTADVVTILGLSLPVETRDFTGAAKEFKTSLLSNLPPLPVPCMPEESIPFSATIFLTAGLKAVSFCAGADDFEEEGTALSTLASFTETESSI